MADPGRPVDAVRMSQQRDEVAAKARVRPSMGVRAVIQIFDDRVWCAWFVEMGVGDGKQVWSSSFDRPAGKTLDEAANRAMDKLNNNRPEAFTSADRQREEW